MLSDGRYGPALGCCHLMKILSPVRPGSSDRRNAVVQEENRAVKICMLALLPQLIYQDGVHTAPHFRGTISSKVALGITHSYGSQIVFSYTTSTVVRNLVKVDIKGT